MVRFSCQVSQTIARLTSVFIPMAMLAAALALPEAVQAQINNQYGYNNRSVGGISINADGVLDNASIDAMNRLAKARKAELKRVPAELNAKVTLRKVSLRNLEETIAACLNAQKPLPDGIKYLGGLQQIQYVFVYPESNDVVLVGPAEGWKTDPRGNLIGVTTGKPVMLLDDLLVALRSAESAARSGGITCSIDPTADGLKQLQTYLSKQKTIGDPQQTATNIEQTMGRQQISFTGVSPTTHFARVLIGADYRMKRLAMNFDPSPIKALPSFLQMTTAGGRGMSNMLPRWWLEPQYEAILRDPTGMAWELRGAGVKTMTEEDFVSAGGQRERTGKANVIAQRWANKMTEHYEELSLAEPIFGELRNCMELAIVGALIARERLLERARCSLPTIMIDGELKPVEFVAPTEIDSKVTMLKKGHNWLISASGGVAINFGAILSKVQADETPAAVRANSAAKAEGLWFWN